MKKIIFGIFVLGALILAGCAQGETVANEIPEEGLEMEEAQGVEWVDFELKDVSSGENFKVSDFNDKPVLLESFAVWCPSCTRQQNEVKKLHEEVGEDIVSIGLNTDPNEDETKVLEHIQENGFDWFYAVSPVEMTQALIDEFGVGIVNAPSVPMILICPGGEYKQLERGVKLAEELMEEVRMSCVN